MDGDEIKALMASGLPCDAKVRMIRQIYIAVCEVAEDEGFEITRDVHPDVASENLYRFFRTKAGAIAAYKTIQMLACLGANQEDVKGEMEARENWRKKESDFSRN